jgi:hypothetical protein
MGKTYRRNSDSFERKRKNKNRMENFKGKSKPMKFDKNRITEKDDGEYA